MSLYLNMGYYHNRISKNASNLCMIILPWGKHGLKNLPLGIDNSTDIFQQKMNDLFHIFEFIRAYKNDLLMSTKRYWIYHVQKFELTLNKLKGKGLKFNIENYFFGQTEMENLGLWVTRFGVKPLNRKI